MIQTVIGNEPPPSFYLCGNWANLVLYVLELFVGFYYFFHNDALNGWVMAGSLCVDTVGTMSACWLAWVTLLFKWTVEESREPYLILSITTGMSAVLEQTYFAFRIWRITRSKILAMILTLLILAPLACILVAVSLAFILGPKDPEKLYNASIIFVVFNDLLISILLVYKLSSLDLPRYASYAKSPVLRALAYIIACGCLTALASTIGTVLVFVSSGGFVIYLNCIGRVYTLTVLINFVFFHEWGSINEAHAINKNSSQSLSWPIFRSDTQVTPRLPASTRISGLPREAVVEVYTKHVPGPPFSMESIFGSNEDVSSCSKPASRNGSILENKD